MSLEHRHIFKKHSLLQHKLLIWHIQDYTVVRLQFSGYLNVMLNVCLMAISNIMDRSDHL